MEKNENNPPQDIDVTLSKVSDGNPFYNPLGGAKTGFEETSQKSDTQKSDTQEDGTLIGDTGDDAFVYEEDSFVEFGGDVSESLEIFDSSIDLGSLNPVSVDPINLESALDTHLSLSVSDVQNISSSGYLTIESETTDRIDLKGDWTQGESADGYTVYTSGESTISIDDSIVQAGGVYHYLKWFPMNTG